MRTATLLLSFALFLLGCRETPRNAHPETAPETSEEAAGENNRLGEGIQPRAMGAQWYYKSYYYEDGVKEPGGFTYEKVIEEREIQGQLCYLVELTNDWRSFLERLASMPLDPADLSYFWEFEDARGSHNYWLEEKSDPPPATLADFDLTLPYPVQVGHRYRIADEEWEVLRKETITLADKTYDCVVYQLTSKDEADPEYGYRERLYQSPGTGLVRWESDSWIDGKWGTEYIDELFKVTQ